MLSHAKSSNSFWRGNKDGSGFVKSITFDSTLRPDFISVWNGKNSSYSHLGMFGCRAFAHISRDERAKLDGNAKECIFLVYAHEDFDYRL